MLAAANMAASIKYFSPDVVVVLHHEENTLAPLLGYHKGLFDRIEPMLVHEFTGPHGIDPGKLKTRLHKFSKEPFLYLDVDGAVVKDIRPWLAELQRMDKPFACEVISRGKPGTKLDYFDWVTQEKFLEKTGPVPMIYAVQTSWMWIDPRNEFYPWATDAREAWSLDELTNRWGASIPDELSYATACALCSMDPDTGKRRVFFGREERTSVDDIASAYDILSLYGQGGNFKNVKQRYLEMYDRLMTKIYASWNERNHFKTGHIMPDKYVNFTAKLYPAAAAASRASLPSRAPLHAPAKS